ncbi:MAG: hypothetical protein ACRCXZ_00380, partial [Patescibacteria group bacterium]
TWTFAAIFTAGKDIAIDTASLKTSIILLIASSLALLLVFFGKKFKLSKLIAVILMFLYILYVVWISLETLGIINVGDFVRSVLKF